MRTTRYYLCAVVGDGLAPETGFRAKLPAGTPHTALIPTGGDGRPLASWCLCLVLAEPQAHAAIAADPDCDPLPPIGWEESPRNSLNQGQLTALANRLRNRGVSNANADVVSSGNLRQLVRAIGRQLTPDFDETQFGPGDQA